MTKRAYNLSPGPAILPEEVLAIVKENILSYQNSGIGVMEMSHRSAAFEEIIASAEANLRKLLSISDDYTVLFMVGGASLQFSAVPMNLLKEGQSADYILTGMWSEKAAAEAKKFGTVNIAATAKDKNYSYIPQAVTVSPNAAYAHFTSNNTIFGTQFRSEPNVGSSPLVCDASSDFLHKKLDVSKYGIIYAGAQKNLGPAGVTIVIMQKALLERSPKDLPLMMDYNTFAANKSLYNTPPTFPIYVVGEVLKWIDRQGGLDSIYKRNQEKANALYEVIDGGDFYDGHAERDARSLMNVTFRLKNRDLEPTFIKEALTSGFAELGGHRSVGGMRASIYNAFPLEGAKALGSFMRHFAEKNG